MKTIYRLFATLWKMLKGISILIIFLFIITFPFAITNNWLYRVAIIIGGLLILSFIGFLIKDKEEERYFLIIPLKPEEALPLFTIWIKKEGFSLNEECNKNDLRWLKTKTRNQYRVYNFYNLSNNLTVISENILQEELRNQIDVLFSKEVKSISEVLDALVYYIAEEHSVDWYEIFSHGKQEKILSFYTHGPGIEQFKEWGINISEEEIKRRDYFSNEDYIRGLGFPVEIHKRNIRQILKNAINKKRIVFCK